MGRNYEVRGGRRWRVWVGAVPKLRQSMEVRKKAQLIEELHFGGKGGEWWGVSWRYSWEP